MLAPPIGDLLDPRLGEVSSSPRNFPLSLVAASPNDGSSAVTGWVDEEEEGIMGTTAGGVFL